MRWALAQTAFELGLTDAQIRGEALRWLDAMRPEAGQTILLPAIRTAPIGLAVLQPELLTGLALALLEVASRNASRVCRCRRGGGVLSGRGLASGEQSDEEDRGKESV